MSGYVLEFGQIDRGQAAVVGGKGAHLGELSRIDGVSVPAGFCVTTDAFQRVMADAAVDEPIDRLSRLSADDREDIGELGADIRAAIEKTAIPDDVAAPIVEALGRFGADGGYAVRSSATAEDLPTASFAGQQDTYLNVTGTAAVLEHIGRCWASLFTDRAVTYRLRNGFEHRRVGMAVVVQRMVAAGAAGVLFTADPVTSHRGITSIEATVGLGEALVSGLVNPDVYQVRGGDIVAKTVGAKQLAVHALPGGGTRQHTIGSAQRERPVLTDAQIVRLSALGRQIEAHFGRPQDIEWCLADDAFHIVQSRPITTLFPIPDAGDDANHVYISVGHQQMMTDAMKPLGLSFWQLTTPRPMAEAGGRLFVDVTPILGAARTRADLLGMVGRSDPLVEDALRTVLDRGDFIPPVADEESTWSLPGSDAPTPIETDPAIVDELIEFSRASVAATKRRIETKSGPGLFEFILDDIQELRRVQFDSRNIQAVMAGIDATWWLNEHLGEWLGEKNPADALTLSVPNNVTSQMGLALLDVADAIRPHPEVVAHLRESADDDFLDGLATLDGGPQSRDAIREYLDTYGMRCVGEIDLTRPRWSERPSALLPMILANIDNFAPGASRRRFEQGRREAARKERELLERLRCLPDGEDKAAETKRVIDRVRTFIGYREYPKYSMISRYFVYKRALLGEAERLARAGVLAERDDAFFLTFQEFHEAVRTNRVDRELIRRRADEFAADEALTPPRVLTSDGEALTGAYRRDDLPVGALVGLPVSAGTVEGRARVILDMAQADPEPGDILVTTHTDPSWSPLFVAIAGLVTEVGGLMTHGAVIAREYGLPAVVGVEHATRLIRDGQRIRVNGADGYVEILA